MQFPTSEWEAGDFYNPSDPTMKLACKVAYFGWYAQYGDYAVDGGILAADMENVKLDYVFTQKMIWETLNQDNGTFIDGEIAARYEDFKRETNAKIQNMLKTPSFDGNVIEVDVDSVSNITDKNGVLKDYKTIDITVNNIRFQHNYGEDTLKITVGKECTLQKYKASDDVTYSWGLYKAESEDVDTTIYFDFPTNLQDQLYSLNFNDPVGIMLELKINQYGNLELTKTNQNKDLIDGSIFELKGENGFKEEVTVLNGKILVDKLKPGQYTLKETSAPNGYVLDARTYTIEITSNETTKQTVENVEPTGKISINKVDSETGDICQGDAEFNGAVYQLFAGEDVFNKAKTKKYYSKGEIVASRTINAKGKTNDIENLPLGKYILKETTAPTGYLKDETEYEVNLKYKDQNTKVIVQSVISKEDVKKMKVHLFKSGIKENSGITPGLAQAQFSFKLYADVEKAIKEGFTYEEIWEGIDKEGNRVDVNNQRVKQAQIIAPTRDKIVTDDKGNAYTIELPFGKYVGKETKTPNDFYTAKDFTFSITKDSQESQEIENKMIHLIINNEPIESYVKLVKKDKKTNKIVTLSSTTFQIKAAEDICDRATGEVIYKKGEPIYQKIGSTIYSSFTTNSDNVIVPQNSYTNSDDDKGTTISPLKLPVGEYIIDEIQTPTNFLKLSEPVKFIIKDIRDYDTDVDGDFIKEINIYNEQPTAKIIIQKKIALREEIDKTLINTENLSGISFKLQAKEDILDYADGSILYSKGKTIGIYHLNEKGKLEIEQLPLGKYELIEWETLDGLILNQEAYEIEFTAKDNIIKIYEESREIENKTTLIEFHKTDIDGKELLGATLELYDMDNNLIDSWVSIEKGHRIEGLTIGKQYKLIEKNTPKEYVQSKEIEFYVQNSEEIQEITMIDKQLEVIKIDSITKELIEGAELEIYDMDNNLIDSWVSKKEPYLVTGLVEGEKYKLVEKNAPIGFLTSKKDIEFTVKEDKILQKIEMEDEPITKKVQVQKIDRYTNEHIKSNRFVFGIYSDQECLNLIYEAGANEYEGTALFSDLRYGTYYIKEISAPLGYELSDEIVKVTINDEGVFANEKNLEEDNGIYKFIYYNSLLPIIVQTSDSSTIFPIILLTISALGIIFSFVLIIKSKDNKGESNGRNN